MKPFNKIAIIGVGLIGGSIGLAVKRKRLAKKITGICRHQASLKKAQQIGAIDQGTFDYKKAVQNAELVILACPVSQIIKCAKKIIPYLKKNCLVTDVGSTKLKIVQTIEKLYASEGLCFVGAHPLAGSEKKGANFAYADLFKGAICILTRSKSTDLTALKRLARFWSKIGCRIKVLSPQRHDRVVALISHLPHLAATQLVNVAGRSLDFASAGFFDTTRIASSEAEIWTDIFLTNERFLLQAIEKYLNQLRKMEDLIRKGDRKELSSELRKAKKIRNALQK